MSAENKYGEDAYGQGVYGYADSEMVQLALDELMGSKSGADQNLYDNILTLKHQGQGAARAGTPPRESLDVLEEFVSEIDRQAKEAGILRKRAGGASSFFLIILDELRTIICGKGKTPKRLGSNSQAVISAVAAVVAGKLGFSGPTAIGVAVLMLIALGRATKNAFCKMSDLDVLKALKR